MPRNFSLLSIARPRVHESVHEESQKVAERYYEPLHEDGLAVEAESNVKFALTSLYRVAPSIHRQYRVHLRLLAALPVEVIETKSWAPPMLAVFRLMTQIEQQ